MHLQVERRTGKVRRPKTDDIPLCHATYKVLSSIFILSFFATGCFCMCVCAYSSTKLVIFKFDFWLSFQRLHRFQRAQAYNLHDVAVVVNDKLYGGVQRAKIQCQTGLHTQKLIPGTLRYGEPRIVPLISMEHRFWERKSEEQLGVMEAARD